METLNVVVHLLRAGLELAECFVQLVLHFSLNLLHLIPQLGHRDILNLFHIFWQMLETQESLDNLSFIHVVLLHQNL